MNSRHPALPALTLWLSLSSGLLPHEAKAQSQTEGGSPGPVEPAPVEPAPVEPAPRDDSAPAARSAPVAEAAPTSEPKPEPGPPTEPASSAVKGPPAAPGGASDEAEPKDEVVVLGSRVGRVAGSAHSVGKKQLERYEYDDAHAVLSQVPGVYVRQEDGTGLRPNIGFRGVNPDRTKKVTLLEDGVLFGPAPYSAPAAYYFPLLTRMTEVSVVKGPGAIVYGPQTVAGALELTTRPIPLSTEGSVDLALGAFGFQKAHAYFGSSTEQIGFLLEGVRLGNTGFMRLPDLADTGSTRNEWMAKVSYLLDPTSAAQDLFDAKLTYSDEVSNETYLGQTDADFREDPYRRYAASALDQMRSHRISWVVRHQHSSADDTLRVVTQVYRHDLGRTWNKLNRLGQGSIATALASDTDPAWENALGVLRGALDTGGANDYLYIGPNQRTFFSQGIQSQLRKDFHAFGLSHRFETGIRLHSDEVRRLHTEKAYSTKGGEILEIGSPTLTTASDTDQSYALAAHLRDTMTLGPWELSPGVRFEFIQSFEDNQLTERRGERSVAAVLPGIGGFYEVLPNFGLLSGVHRGFSPPPPGSGSDTESESSVNYEAGFRYQKSARRLEWIGFYNDYQNLTDVCTLASGCINVDLERQFDAGRARVFGFEIFASDELRLPYGFRLPAQVAYTLSRGEFLTAFESQDPVFGSVEALDEVPYLPLHQANLSVALERSDYGVHASVNYSSKMRETADQGEFSPESTTDEQFWLDAGASYRPVQWLKIYFEIRNLSDERYLVSRRPFGARVNPPRWVQLGIKADF